MPTKRHIMGLFKSEDKVVAAINALKQSSYEFVRVNTPIPSHKIMDALQLKTSWVGWFTLCGGILGFIAGFALAIFTATRWNLIVSGKPINSKRSGMRKECLSSRRLALDASVKRTSANVSSASVPTSSASTCRSSNPSPRGPKSKPNAVNTTAPLNRVRSSLPQKAL